MFFKKIKLGKKREHVRTGESAFITVIRVGQAGTDFSDLLQQTLGTLSPLPISSQVFQLPLFLLLRHLATGIIIRGPQCARELNFSRGIVKTKKA